MTINSTGVIGVGTAEPVARVFEAFTSNTSTPSLTWKGGNPGQRFVNEGSELKFGLTSYAPYAYFIQANTSGSGHRQLTLNPMGGSVGIGITDPPTASGLVARYDSTFVPTLTWNAAGGHILRDEGSELNFGLSSITPHPFFIQGRTSGNAVRQIAINPLGGNVAINTSIAGNTLNLGDNAGVGVRFHNYTSNNNYYLTVESGDKVSHNVGGSGYYTWITGGSEKVRIDNSGRLLLGATTSRDNDVHFQIEGLGYQSATMQITRNSANADGGGIYILKTRGSSDDSSTIVQSGDQLGYINFRGADGTDGNTNAATIEAFCDGTPGSNDMPGRLIFSTTADGASSSTERLRIDSGGRTTAQGLTLNDNGISGTIFQLNPDDEGPWAFHLQNQTYSTGMEGLKIYQGNSGVNYMQLRADGSYGRFYIQGHNGSASAVVLQTLANGDVTTCSPSTFDRANAGFTARKGDAVAMTRASGTPVEVNRTGDDGNLVSFYQAGSVEGTISVSGSSVSYNGGVLTRWSQFVGLSTNNTGDRPVGIYTGTVMSNLDEMCEWAGEDNIQLNKTQVSAAGSDRNVAGVFWGWDNDPADDGYVNDFYIAQTGDYIIRVGAGVTVTKGDLLESAGNGTARPQSDDIIRSNTIAKVSSNVGIMTYADNSYCVPCVLMAC